MTKLKCLASIVLGTFLGLFGACKQSAEPPAAPTAPTAKKPTVQQTEKAKTPAKPAVTPRKEEDLPVREPMLE